MPRGLLGFDVPDQATATRKRYPFLWSVVLLLLTGTALASWIGSFYIIGHPEIPRCYRFLKKIKKLESPWQFGVISDPVKRDDPARKGRRTEPPRGTFLSPKQLLERAPKNNSEVESLLGFGRMGEKQMTRNNAELLRMYLKNYRENGKSVPYVTGVFEVVAAHELQAGDFFPSGVVALTQAKDYPQVLVEMVFPASGASKETIMSLLPTGREITLERSKDLAAVIHCERVSNSQMQFTVVPLFYGAFQLRDARGSFTLKSPEDLEDPKYGGDPKNAINIEGTFPLVNGMRLQKAMAGYAEYRKKMLLTGDAERQTASQIVALRAAAPGGNPVEVATPVIIREAPAVPVVPVNPPAPPATPTPALTNIAPPKPLRPPLINSNGPTGIPERFPLPPRPVVRATPTPPPAVPKVEDPPKPVVIALPKNPETATPPPQKPNPRKRRLVSTRDASAMVDSFDTAQEALLGGEFIVTGVLGQRVALRAREALRDPEADPTKAGNSGAMIVVDFPDGITPPAQDETVSRDDTHAFLIKSVRRAGNGQITIFAEEQPKQ